MPAVALLVVLLELVSAGLVRAQVIPPGNEEALAAMLGRGARLPDGCTFGGGQIERSVRATYHCPQGDVRIELSPPSVGEPHAIRTDRFTLSVLSGSPPDGLIRALEASIRAKEAGIWNTRGVDESARGVFALLLLGLTGLACVSGWRARSAGRPMAPRIVLESLIVAAVVVIWLHGDADPPAHADTAVDVALARDCIASGGTSCVGHAASAIGLVQGQAFTYALAAWLHLGLSMRSLALVAACGHGAVTGLLHYVNSRRFGGVAWLVSAFIAELGVQMAGYPTIWNPSWFPLPLCIAFVATLAITRSGGLWSPFVAGVAFALTAEAHILFAAFVAVAVALVLVAAERAIAAVPVLLVAFVLVEVVISPGTSALNAIALRTWLEGHLVAAVLVGCLLIASVPVLLGLRRRLVGRDREPRERVVVVLWLLAGVVALGLVLPWAASRPQQIRYYGAALPAIAWTGAWLCHAVTARAPSAAVWTVSLAVFAAAFTQRMASHDVVPGAWLMDDGIPVAVSSGLVDTSALDVQMTVRSVPEGPLAQVVAAFVGTPGLPAFPLRIVRAVRPSSEVPVPNGWSRIRLARGDALVGVIDAWAHPDEAEVCPDPPSGEACILLARDDFRNVALSADGSMHRVFGLRIDRIALAIGGWTGRGTRSLLWRIPLRPMGADDRREIIVLDTAGETIVGVEGTVWTARNANRALVQRPATAATITVRTRIAGKFEAGVPPMPLELREEEVGVLGSALPPGT